MSQENVEIVADDNIELVRHALDLYNSGDDHYAWRTVRAASGVPLDRNEADLPNIRWHDLRHGCATWLLEAGHDHFAVSVQLGHEDGGALVMSRYGHPSKDAALQRLLAGFRPAGHAVGSRTGSGVS